jgi:hypothetical protein
MASSPKTQTPTAPHRKDMNGEDLLISILVLTKVRVFSRNRLKSTLGELNSKYKVVSGAFNFNWSISGWSSTDYRRSVESLFKVKLIVPSYQSTFTHEVGGRMSNYFRRFLPYSLENIWCNYQEVESLSSELVDEIPKTNWGLL